MSCLFHDDDSEACQTYTGTNCCQSSLRYLITTEYGSSYVAEFITESDLEASELGVITITDMVSIKQHDGKNWVDIDKWTTT